MPIVLNLGLRRAARRLGAAAEEMILPHLPVRRDTAIAPPPSAMVMIYRRRNIAMAEALVAQARECGLFVLLWALDGVAASLADVTAGHGPGSRSTLLTRLVQECRLGAGEYLVVCDDDAEFAVGGFSHLLQIAVECGFMVSQPAHVLDSHYSFPFTCGRPYLTARSTHFVEIGPMLVIHPAFRDRVFPMRAELGMGWGAEVEWHSALRDNEHFGIIDAVRIRHCSPVGVDYDTAAEQARLDGILRAAGIADSNDMCRVIKPWYRWNKWRSEARLGGQCLSPQTPRRELGLARE